VDNILRGRGEDNPRISHFQGKMAHMSYGQWSEETVTCTEAIKVV